MKREKVDLNFRSYRDSKLHVFALSILTKMTRNPNFLPPYTPSLTDLSTAITNYWKALVASNGNFGGKAQTIAKDEARKALRTLMKDLGLYVDRVANGNKAIILSSGFKVRKPTPTGPLPTPKKLKISDRQRSKIKLKVDAVKGTRIYQWEYIPTSDLSTGIWTEVKTTKSSVTIEGLQSGQQYTFRVVALGKNQQVKNYSHTVTSYIL